MRTRHHKILTTRRFTTFHLGRQNNKNKKRGLAYLSASFHFRERRCSIVVITSVTELETEIKSQRVRKQNDAKKKLPADSRESSTQSTFQIESAGTAYGIRLAVPACVQDLDLIRIPFGSRILGSKRQKGTQKKNEFSCFLS